MINQLLNNYSTGYSDKIREGRLYRQVVVDTHDPTNSGRIKVFIPSLFDIHEVTQDQLPYAEPLLHFYKQNPASREIGVEYQNLQGRGIINIPQIGEQVWVLIFNNDISNISYLPLSYGYKGFIKESPQSSIPYQNRIKNNNWQGFLQFQSKNHGYYFYDDNNPTELRGMYKTTEKGCNWGLFDNWKNGQIDVYFMNCGNTHFYSEKDKGLLIDSTVDPTVMTSENQISIVLKDGSNQKGIIVSNKGKDGIKVINEKGGIDIIQNDPNKMIVTTDNGKGIQIIQTKDSILIDSKEKDVNVFQKNEVRLSGKKVDVETDCFTTISQGKITVQMCEDKFVLQCNKNKSKIELCPEQFWIQKGMDLTLDNTNTLYLKNGKIEDTTKGRVHYDQHDYLIEQQLVIKETSKQDILEYQDSKHCEKQQIIGEEQKYLIQEKSFNNIDMWQKNNINVYQTNNINLTQNKNNISFSQKNEVIQKQEKDVKVTSPKILHNLDTSTDDYRQIRNKDVKQIYNQIKTYIEQLNNNIQQVQSAQNQSVSDVNVSNYSNRGSQKTFIGD